MNARAMNTHAGGQRPRMGIETLEGREEGRVNVEHPPFPQTDERGRQQAHEAGKADELDACALEHGLEGSFECIPVLAV